MKETYSQGGQDLFVLSMFEKTYSGIFVDIGCQRPIYINNTLLLEKNGWKGISIDIVDYTNEWKIRKTPFINADGLNCDYKRLFVTYDIPKIIDYLSVDVEQNGDRFKVLKKVFESEHEFKILTVEHDAYQGYEETERKKQRDFLLDHKYFLLCSNVSLIIGAPYEDWWINPIYFNIDEYKHLIFVDPSDKDILYTEILKKIKLD